MGGSIGCGPLNEIAGVRVDPLLVGVGSPDRTILYEFAGPAGTAHFVVELQDERVAIGAIEVRAVFASVGRPEECSGVPLMVEAWSDEQFLSSEEPVGFC